MRSSHQDIVEVTSGTSYTEAFTTGFDSRVLGAQAKMSTGSATVTLQGGWVKDSTTDADWIDLDLTSVVSGSSIVELFTADSERTIYSLMAQYRFKVVTTASATLEVRVMEL